MNSLKRQGYGLVHQQSSQRFNFAIPCLHLVLSSCFSVPNLGVLALCQSSFSQTRGQLLPSPRTSVVALLACSSETRRGKGAPRTSYGIMPINYQI
ncbi:uncharacterized protein CIMG_12264 [Coccidioides immitis RS]|uniref:Uncharacterized protein n=4 Tax=Coccidioides immitis TaxID=5501 RepID=A0A0D8JW12_COCIM|nr:uncharacterized protein CIMG_12264 [Coccidioides immitis RS]KJF61309.1 hypothetical protein CIMG_12264 [Coccidioides immitis RS]KMP08614.1 hypothetical protein CIRG_08295 [Coccidioides immitis RMSCC 2394]KMU78616.1 hypothetical protein CISG_01656 [Coccidioides immitis RMSCC 3703]KMU87432.1 hypothetical protein CIHG_05227 [Coccidioides immitis H538.4]